MLVIAGLLVAADLFLPAGLSPPRERRVVLVSRGESLRGVARELERVGLLRGTLGFEALARLMRLDRSIKAGQYSFRLGITVPELLRAFARGMSGLNLITLPEGLTTSEISLLLSNRLGVPTAAFDSLAQDRAFLDSLGISAPSIEGYLAPDSYEFLPGTSPEVAFRTMATRQREVLLKSAVGRDSLPLGMSLHEVLTLASIVESEAQWKDERERIASVYLNRLQKRMRLQADPTVAYGLGLGPRSRLYIRQLHSESPFNTYLFEGLPPGPICNPGHASITAVLDPMPGVKDLYFVARGEGRHLFAETYPQHLKNIVAAHARIAAGNRGAGETADSLAPPGLAPPDTLLGPRKR
ncbi:MAG: endolytic transglycosylase MltG [Candidatus Eisenbacteria bacterium]|nr:endolytic transglycosylase MltG [Candidatus Eisenbacteria bacterium]